MAKNICICYERFLLSNKICFHCKSPVMRRLNRVGFFQRVFLPWFGFYPWECVMCRRRSFYHDAGHRPSERGAL